MTVENKEVTAVPRKPRRGCGYPGCPRLAVDGGQYCEEHKSLTNKQYDRYQRDPDFNKRYDSKWKKIRARYVALHPLCEMCLKEGRYVPVEEVHHIKPLSQGGTHAESNLMSLCKSCHTKLHMEIGDRQIRK